MTGWHQCRFSTKLQFLPSEQHATTNTCTTAIYHWTPTVRNSMEAEQISSTAINAKRLVVPKSFKACAFPMYKLNWERLGNKHLCPSLQLYICASWVYTSIFKRCTGLDTSVHFPGVSKLVHGECTSLETLAIGNYKLGESLRRIYYDDVIT